MARRCHRVLFRQLVQWHRALVQCVAAEAQELVRADPLPALVGHSVHGCLFAPSSLVALVREARTPTSVLPLDPMAAPPPPPPLLLLLLPFAEVALAWCDRLVILAAAHATHAPHVAEWAVRRPRRKRLLDACACSLTAMVA